MIATAQQVTDAISDQRCISKLNDLAREFNQIIDSFTRFEIQTVADVFQQAEIRIKLSRLH